MPAFLEIFKVLGINTQILERILDLSWQIIRVWWWLPLPFIFWPYFKYQYLFYRNSRWDSTIKKLILEIKIPKEIPKPIRAMEHVFSGIHAVHDIPTWREKWIEGQFQMRFSLEIASLEGEIHFYIRLPETFRNIFEASIYAHYPEVEISEVPDYTKNVPQDIPNKDWDLWGTDLINTREEVYPLKTYSKFEKEIALEATEEKRIDPLVNLLEGMASLGPGEQMWVQIVAKPIRAEKPWVKKGLELRDKLAKRPAKPAPKPMIQEALEIIISGKPAGTPPAEKEVIPPEMKLTPGEKEIITAIEEKISKFGFDCNIRYIYLGRRDVFFRPKARIPYGFFKAVSAENMGGLKPDKRTITKVKSVLFWFLDQRRLYLRKRRIFRYYQRRWTPFFPRPGGTFVLNTEELATLYHFPSQKIAPTPSLVRIETKKGEAPLDLPVE